MHKASRQTKSKRTVAPKRATPKVQKRSVHTSAVKVRPAVHRVVKSASQQPYQISSRSITTTSTTLNSLVQTSKSNSAFQTLNKRLFSSGPQAGQVYEWGPNDKADIIKNTKGLVVIDWFADWCGPCRTLGPHLANKATKHQDVTFVKVNADEFSAEDIPIPGMPQIQNLPTLVFVKDSKVVEVLVGFQPARLDNAIEQHSV